MGDAEWTECKRRSDIWKYFVLDNKHKDKVKCKKCSTVLYNYKSSTTDMWRHLQRSHHMSSSKKQSGDEYSIPNEDSMGNKGSFENRIESQKHTVIETSASLRSEMAEVSSLLSLAMPMANVNFLVDEGKGKDDTVAIEVRPRERLFRAYRTPPAKWSAIILWLPSSTVCVFILKMDRQIMDSREFRASQTLEAVDFVKSHPFINAKWTMCSGPSHLFTMPDKFFEDYGNGVQIYRSVKCELLVMIEGDNIMPTQCKFCQSTGVDVKEDKLVSESLEMKLPGGWVKKIIPRKSGVSAGQTDAYLFAPDGTVIRSANALAKYCSNTGIIIDTTVINLEKPRQTRNLEEGHQEIKKEQGEFDNNIGSTQKLEEVEFKNSKMNIDVESKDADWDESIEEGVTENDDVVDKDFEQGDKWVAESLETKLPGGWTKKIIPRKNGASAGQIDVYLYAPDGTKIRSTKSLTEYCFTTGIKIDPSVINLEKPGRLRKQDEGQKEVKVDEDEFHNDGESFNKSEVETSDDASGENSDSFKHHESIEESASNTYPAVDEDTEMAAVKNVNSHKKSAVWKHFSLSKDKTYTSCCHCQKRLTAEASSSTSSMLQHLRRRHPLELEASIDDNASMADHEVDKPEHPKEWRSSSMASNLWNFFTRMDTEISLCNTCGKETQTKGSNTANMYNHLKYHHFTDYQQIRKQANLEVPQIAPERRRRKERFMCDLCGTEMSNDSKVAHMARKHQIYLGKKYTCETCGKVCWSTGTFNAHKRTHNQDVSHTCCVCGKHFRSKHGMQLCEMNCKGDFRFECSTCGRKFLQKNRLISHEMIHTGERPFGCPIPGCDSAYSGTTNLYTHVKINHKRKLKEVLEEQGMEFVYAKGSGNYRGMGGYRGDRIIGIKGIEVKNVGPTKVREPKGYKKLKATSEVP